VIYRKQGRGHVHWTWNCDDCDYVTPFFYESEGLAEAGLAAHQETCSARAKPKPKPKAKRGTSNGNANGNSTDRRRRKEWLIEIYRADTDARVRFGTVIAAEEGHPDAEPACRCYRCGTLCTFETVTVDRIIPGCRGGTYRRNNIRPACGACNSKTGGAVRG
jgi:5-methylcytosine-specific restriction endonuclease McrA